MNTGLKLETSQKKMKFSTTDFAKEFSSENALRFNDGFGVPSERIDNESSLLRGTNTNPRFRQDLGPLPLRTLGGRTTNGPYASPDVGRDKKSCSTIEDNHFMRIFRDYSKVERPVSYLNRSGDDSRSGFRST